jgi:hypothetical protein
MVLIGLYRVVLYFGKTNEWIILKPEHFLNCTINGKVMTFSYWEEDKGK